MIGFETENFHTNTLFSANSIVFFIITPSFPKKKVCFWKKQRPQLPDSGLLSRTRHRRHIASLQNFLMGVAFDDFINWTSASFNKALGLSLLQLLNHIAAGKWEKCKFFSFRVYKSTAFIPLSQNLILFNDPNIYFLKIHTFRSLKCMIKQRLSQALMPAFRKNT